MYIYLLALSTMRVSMPHLWAFSSFKGIQGKIEKLVQTEEDQKNKTAICNT